MLKFNQSKDGVYRATVRVSYRIGRDALIQATAFALIEDEVVTSRDRVEKMVRDMLEQHGPDWPYAHEAYGEEIDEFTDEATDLVDRLFPEVAERAS